ncbi:hypothetical protein [Escherichia coli]|uniref:hypothetical protein n=1 Tax=Escherichia coli TaxID=562 RepID=UPI002FCD4066
MRTRLQAAITLFRERYEGERERITETASPLGTDVPGNHSEHEERGGIRAGCRSCWFCHAAHQLTQKQVQADSLSAVAGVAVVRRLQPCSRAATSEPAAA